MISVLIPTYMPSDYLDLCFYSLEKQILSKSKYTVYICLNGPKENYENHVKSLLSKYNFNYQYIYIDTPGASNARNKLIEISSEQYVCFVDDDDQISSNYLNELLLNSTEEIIGISNIYNFQKSTHERKENYIGKRFKKINDIEHSLIKCREYFSSPCAKLIHREIIADTRFDIKLSRGEDSLFMATLSKRVIGVKKTNKSACYYVYERQGSVSRKKSSIISKIKRSYYLNTKYILMLFQGYNFPFILTRIAATIFQIIK